MATASSITDPLLRTYTRVLPVGVGVCDVCHGAPGTGWERCWSCATSIGQVSRPIELVVPISLTEKFGQLHHSLRSYKREDLVQSVRDRFSVELSALLYRFLNGHAECIRDAAGSDWDTVTIVPSSSGRTGVHPLERVIGMSRTLSSQYEPLLEAGSDPARHNDASDDAYRPIAAVRGRRVLLVDDTFTSGARVQSAASALQLAGATVVAAVPIGRVINPDYNAESRVLWDRASGQGFDFNVCCLDT